MQHSPPDYSSATLHVLGELWEMDRALPDARGVEDLPQVISALDEPLRSEVFERIQIAISIGLMLPSMPRASVMQTYHLVVAAHVDQGRKESAAPADMQPLDVMVDPDSLVYYIRFGERVKIGTTTNLARRLGQLPFDEVLAVEPGGRGVESARHRQFAHLRIRGEWFHATPDLLSFIENVGALSAT